MFFATSVATIRCALTTAIFAAALVACGSSDGAAVDADGTGEPDSADANDEVPDTGVPDTVTADTSIPDATVPDATVPDATVPDTGVPDATVPDTSAPDTEAPDTSDPDTSGPDTEAPDASAVDAEVSDTLAPVPPDPGPDEGYQWIEVTANAAFAPRDGAGALVHDGRMWLLGGWNPLDPVHFPSVTNSEVWSSVDGATWTLEVLAAPWEGRHVAGYVTFGGRLWVLGGDPNRGHYQRDIWSSANGRDWTREVEVAPWTERAIWYTVTMNDAIYVMGGQVMPQFAGAPPPDGIFYDDVWRSTNGRDWTRITEHAGWPARGLIGGQAVLHGRMWLLGGGTYDTPLHPTRLFYNDVWSSPDGITWTEVLKAAPWEPRQFHDVASWDGRLWALEGWHHRNLADVWYSGDGTTWHEVPNTPWAARHAASIYVFDDALWVVTGHNLTSDVWKLVDTTPD